LSVTSNASLVSDTCGSRTPGRRSFRRSLKKLWLSYEENVEEVESVPGAGSFPTKRRKRFRGKLVKLVKLCKNVGNNVKLQEPTATEQEVTSVVSDEFSAARRRKKLRRQLQKVWARDMNPSVIATAEHDASEQEVTLVVPDSRSSRKKSRKSRQRSMQVLVRGANAHKAGSTEIRFVKRCTRRRWRNAKPPAKAGDEVRSTTSADTHFESPAFGTERRQPEGQSEPDFARPSLARRFPEPETSECCDLQVSCGEGDGNGLGSSCSLSTITTFSPTLCSQSDDSADEIESELEPKCTPVCVPHGPPADRRSATSLPAPAPRITVVPPIGSSVLSPPITVKSQGRQIIKRGTVSNLRSHFERAQECDTPSQVTRKSFSCA